MLTVDEHRHQNGVVGTMGVAEVYVVVDEGVALGQIGVQLTHRLGQELRAEDVHR
jgi:hypothetical protein